MTRFVSSMVAALVVVIAYACGWAAAQPVEPPAVGK